MCFSLPALPEGGRRRSAHQQGRLKPASSSRANGRTMTLLNRTEGCGCSSLWLALKIPARKIGAQTLRHDLGTELAQPENESERSAAGSTHHNLSIRMEINFERLAYSGSGSVEL